MSDIIIKTNSEPTGPMYFKAKKYKATLIVLKEEDDYVFIAQKGSIIRDATDGLKDYSNDLDYYSSLMRIKHLEAESLIKKISDTEYELLHHVAMNSPRAFAVLVSGKEEYGWNFFEGLEDIKKIIKIRT